MSEENKTTAVAEVVNNYEVAFVDIRKQLDDLAEENNSLVFDYSTDEGEKAAKVQMRLLRKVDKLITDKHKILKADALEQCQMIDAVKRDLIARVAEMVDVHKIPLAEKEDAENKRVQAIADRIAVLISYDDKFEGVTDSKSLITGIETLEAIQITADDYEERMAEATKLRESALADLNAQCVIIQKAEADAAELEELRRQKEEREREEREAKIASDAAEKARTDAEAKAAKDKADAAEKAAKDKADAEAKAEEDRLASERAISEAADRENQAIAATAAAELKAKNAKEDARKAEKERQKKIADKAAADEAKRLADLNHVAKIKEAIIEKLVSLGATEALSVKIVEAIQADEVSSVSIDF